MNALALLHEVLDAGLYFALLGIGLGPLERAFAARSQPVLRPQFATDLLFYLGQSLLFTKLTLLLLWFAHDLAAQCAVEFPAYAGLRGAFADLPLWIQICLVVLCSDFLIYWAHRLSHANDWLWRFHRVHHSARRLDWAAAFREHPIDNIYTRLVVNLPALVCGFSLEIIAGFVVFRGFWGNVIHSNTHIGMGPLKFLLGSPRLHHWHHEPVQGMRCNFANLNPLMDVLFGTFYDPGKMPDEYGIRGESDSPGYLAQLVQPLLPQRRRIG